MIILLLNLGGATEPGKGYAQPLGLSYLASYVRSCGFDVRGIDLTLTQKANRQNYMTTNKEVLKRIVKMNPTIIATTCLTSNRHNVMYWMHATKKVLPKVKIVLGGPHASFCSVEMLQSYPEIDFIVKFEGEKIFALLCDKLSKGESVKDIPSLTFRNGEEIIDNPGGERIEDLDSLPFPDTKAFPQSNYHLSVRRFTQTKGKTEHIISSRGCPAQCSFCSSGSFWRRRVRFRSPENVLKEISFLMSTFDMKELIIYDDSFTLKRSRLLETCDLIERLKLRWMCWSRADALDSECLKKMYNSGCRMISIGVESGNDSILASVGKGINKEKVKEVVEACKSANILPRLSFIIGLPGETLETAMDTASLIRSLGLPHSCNVVGWGTWIFPGTPLFSEFKLANPDFTWYNTPKRFYGQADLDRLGNFICPKIRLPKEDMDKVRKAANL